MGRWGRVSALARGLDRLVIGALFLLLGVAALKLALRSGRIGRGLRSEDSRQSEPQEILATRYSRGEIGREEFLEKIRDVRETAQ